MLGCNSSGRSWALALVIFAVWTNGLASENQQDLEGTQKKTCCNLFLGNNC